MWAKFLRLPIFLIFIFTSGLSLTAFSAFGKDHDCCMKPTPDPKPTPKLTNFPTSIGVQFKAVVKEFDLQRDTLKVEITKSKTVATFELRDHLKQKQNEYRELFKKGNVISAKWDAVRKAYRISE